MIRPVTVDDAEELCALYRANRDFLVRFEPTREESFYTVPGQRGRLEHHVHDAANGEGWRFAIMDDGAIAGTINVGDVIRGPLQLANIGYFVDRARNGRGLATGAVADVIDFAFGELDLHRLEAGTLPDNHASQRVLQKNGFERFGLARKLLLIGGTWHDHVLFELLND